MVVQPGGVVRELDSNTLALLTPALSMNLKVGRAVLSPPRISQVRSLARGAVNSCGPKFPFFAQIFTRCIRLTRVAQTSKSAVWQVFNLGAQAFLQRLDIAPG